MYILYLHIYLVLGDFSQVLDLFSYLSYIIYRYAAIAPTQASVLEHVYIYDSRVYYIVDSY